MKLTIGIDPGKSGGYAIAWGGQHKIALHLSLIHISEPTRR